MSVKFSEMLELRNELLHRKAIQRELHDHLEKFVNTDTRAAELGIRSEGEGLIVPQELIIETRECILEDLADIETEIAEIDQREVAENEPQEDDKGVEEDESGGEPVPEDRPETN